MVAPEYVGDGSYWDNTDDVEVVLPQKSIDEAPQVVIPEVPEDHRKALVTSAFGLLLMTGAIATTRYIKRHKAGE